VLVRYPALGRPNAGYACGVIAGLVTLPLRLGLRVAGFALRPVTRALGLVPDDQPAERPRPEPPPVRPREPVRWDRPPRRRRAPTSRADVPAEPEHIEQETELVAEVADRGAEEGAGAQVTVAEPWDGYARMKAGDVIARLADATPEEAAVVQLYEGTHRRRKTVLEAAAYSQRK
jgi:hypothetical protein